MTIHLWFPVQLQCKSFDSQVWSFKKSRKTSQAILAKSLQDSTPADGLLLSFNQTLWKKKQPSNSREEKNIHLTTAPGVLFHKKQIQLSVGFSVNIF